MSRSSVVTEPDEIAEAPESLPPRKRKDLYEKILEKSSEPRWFILDPSTVSPTITRASREERIAGEMSIPIYTLVKRDGEWVQTGPRFLTTEEAEAKLTLLGVE